MRIPFLMFGEPFQSWRGARGDFHSQGNRRGKSTTTPTVISPRRKFHFLPDAKGISTCRLERCVSKRSSSSNLEISCAVDTTLWINCRDNEDIEDINIYWILYDTIIEDLKKQAKAPDFTTTDSTHSTHRRTSVTHTSHTQSAVNRCRDYLRRFLQKR